MKFLGRAASPSSRELTALADGSLPAARHAAVKRAVDASPELTAAHEAQQRVLKAIASTGDESAPAALRAGVATAAAAGHRPPRRLRIAPAFATAAVVLVLVAVGVVELVGAQGTPTVASAALLAQRLPEGPAPAPSGAVETDTLAGLSVAGLAFPYWQDRFGLRATGMRQDTVSGRPTTTVFYRAGGGLPIAYTIVSGAPLRLGAPASRRLENGVWLGDLQAGGREVVTWLRAGHTCVLSGSPGSLTVLARLASWRGGGSLRY